MQIELYTGKLADLATEGLILPLLADVPPYRIRGFDTDLAQLIEKLNQHGDWRGEPGEVAVLYTTQRDERLSGVKRLILVGMGKQADWSYEKMRRAVAAGIHACKARSLADVAVLLPEAVTTTTARDLATIVGLASYSFTQYKTLDRKDTADLETIQLVAETKGRDDDFRQAIADGLAVATATNFVRDLTNHPANQMTPTHLLRDALELADNKEVFVTALDRDVMQKLNMGALLAVAQGSQQEPKLIIAEYRPSSDRRPATGDQELPTIGLAGKGITFDSGGISLKPSEHMDEMKMDMAGAATCLGVIAAAKALKLPVRIVAVMPTTENLPSGSASKPGDIVTAYDGKTIEILNTDAEGRLVLADGIAYLAKEYTPDVIIDLATLTGAALVALGNEAAPILGTSPELIEKIEAAANRTGERVWQLPLWDEYLDMVKSDIADLKNIGERGKAGTITGAAFISYFVPKGVPWVHIDIAGTAMLDKPRAYMPRGGSGWGVRLLVDLIEHWGTGLKRVNSK